MPQTGSVRWRRNTGEPGAETLGSSLLVSESIVMAGDYAVFGFDATSGEPKWRFDPADGYGAGLYLGEARDGVAFAGSPAGRLYAVNVRTGRLIWSAKATVDAGVGTAAVTVFQPIVAGDSVVAGYSTFGHPMTGGIVVVDRGSGRERWRREFPQASPGAATGFGGGPVISRDLIAAASGDGRIYGFDCSSGQLSLGAAGRRARGRSPAGSRLACSGRQRKDARRRLGQWHRDGDRSRCQDGKMALCASGRRLDCASNCCGRRVRLCAASGRPAGVGRSAGRHGTVADWRVQRWLQLGAGDCRR